MPVRRVVTFRLLLPSHCFDGVCRRFAVDDQLLFMEGFYSADAAVDGIVSAAERGGLNPLFASHLVWLADPANFKPVLEPKGPQLRIGSHEPPFFVVAELAVNMVVPPSPELHFTLPAITPAHSTARA